MIVQSFCAEDTYEIGKKIGQEAQPGQVICLYGDLGVGKTVFTKGLADGLGITEPIQSPTFTIVREYEEGRLPLYHFDVYRIGDIEEMDEIGYEDYVYGEGVCLIEWANLIEEILPDHYQKITIRKDLEKGFDYREIEMEEQWMKLLVLDSSGLVASVALIEDDQLIAEYTTGNKLTHSQTLLPMLDEVIKRTSFEIEDIDAVAVAKGPGSFTGLRIGAATAKGLGLALDKPIIPVSTVDGLAYQLFGTSMIICPMMDARRKQVYTGFYRFEGSEMKVLKEQCAQSVEDTLIQLREYNEPVVFLGDGVPVYKEEILEKMGDLAIFAPAHANRQRAAAVGALAQVYFAQGIYESADEFVPEYLRKSQAEREREERLHGQK